MVFKLKIRKIGNSLGVVLPEEVLAHLKVTEGDVLCLTEGAEESLRVTPAQTDFDAQMKAAEDVIKRYRNTLRELAK